VAVGAAALEAPGQSIAYHLTSSPVNTHQGSPTTPVNRKTRKRQLFCAGAIKLLVETGESRTPLSIAETVSSVLASHFLKTSYASTLESDVAKLLTQLLDQLIAIGQTAQQIRHAFDNNAHHPKVADLLKRVGQGDGHDP
jgi:hypothetical protein